MVIGVPKEIKNNENRVALTPAGAQALAANSHEVLVLSGAGAGSGISDEEYERAGAHILNSAHEVYERADLIVKVKEPIAEEYDLLRPDQVLFTYLHLAPNRPLTEALLKNKVTAIAYETVQTEDGSLPLLIPMSEVAGRMSVQVAAMLQQSYFGGSGMLLGGVPGVAPAHVVIVGAGIVGSNAARIAVGIGANVTVLDINQRKLAEFDRFYGGRVNTVMSNSYALEDLTARADVLIGAVLVPGAKAPKTVSEKMVRGMKKGSVIVDVAIDQGGTVETIDRITTHDDPAYEKYGVIHYSVANMPGSVPHTSTWALTGVTLPYIMQIADQGAEQAMRLSKPLMMGLNTYGGHITYDAVARAMDKQCVHPEDALSG